MKMTKFWALAVVAGLFSLSSCSDEDDDNNDNGGNNEPMEEGVQGKWASAGSDVAPLLMMTFGTDSIYAEFSTDMTYVVEQFDTSGAKLTLTGTYTQTESAVSGIWEIELNQSTPSALISEGIFQVENDNRMTYEVVQTDPNIGATPPTAADGFGSSGFGGQALGAANIQYYNRID